MVAKKKTVFVLGAGSSADYGYPIGKDLREKIIDLKSDGNLFEAFVSTDDFDELSMGVDPDLSRGHIERFSNDNPFFNLADRFMRSGKSSIDEFLLTNDDLMPIGKFSIAQLLLKNEVENNLMRFGWSQLLWSRLTKGKRASGEVNHDFGFVTFNYDTSLEYIISQNIRSTFRAEGERAVTSFFEEIPVFHVHGKIKTFPWEGSGGGNYSKNGFQQFENKEIIRMSRGIRLFHETDEDEVLEGLKN